MANTIPAENNENEPTHRRRHVIERLSRDRSISILWAIILIWGAIVLTVETILPSSNQWWNSGGIFLIGTGSIILLEGLYRIIKAERQKRILLRFILGTVFIGAGLATVFSFQGNVIPVILLLLIAVAILVNACLHRSSEK